MALWFPYSVWFGLKEFGVIAEPEVVEWPLHEYKSPYLFAASDGVRFLACLAHAMHAICIDIGPSRSLQ